MNEKIWYNKDQIAKVQLMLTNEGKETRSVLLFVPLSDNDRCHFANLAYVVPIFFFLMTGSSLLYGLEQHGLIYARFFPLSLPSLLFNTDKIIMLVLRVSAHLLLQSTRQIYFHVCLTCNNLTVYYP